MSLHADLLDQAEQLAQLDPRRPKHAHREGPDRDVLRGLADGNTGMMRTSAGGRSPTYAFLETA